MDTIFSVRELDLSAWCQRRPHAVATSGSPLCQRRVCYKHADPVGIEAHLWSRLGLKPRPDIIENFDKCFQETLLATAECPKLCARRPHLLEGGWPSQSRNSFPKQSEPQAQTRNYSAGIDKLSGNPFGRTAWLNHSVSKALPMEFLHRIIRARWPHLLD